MMNQKKRPEPLGEKSHRPYLLIVVFFYTIAVPIQELPANNVDS
jgi:hypothetical protein